MKALHLSAVVCVLAVLPAAQGAISFVNLGTSAPPGTVGGQLMTPFPDDTRPDGQVVTQVASPLGGDLGFSNSVSILTVPTSWSTWGHGYAGDVYFNTTLGLTITLPANTTAFSFYYSPNLFDFKNVSMLVRDSNTSELSAGPISVTGDNGANGFAFYSNDAFLTSIVLTSTDEFAVGEFGIASAIPEPGGTVALGSLLGATLFLRSRRRGAAGRA